MLCSLFTQRKIDEGMRDSENESEAGVETDKDEKDRERNDLPEVASSKFPFSTQERSAEISLC